MAPNGQTPRSRATIPPKQVPQQNQISTGFIHRHFPHIPAQSREYIYGIRRMPTALITAISQSPKIIDKWRLHRHQHIQALINPLTQMYGFHGPDQMTCVAEWLDTTCAYKLGFLQPPHASDQEDYFPHSCPICDPSSPKDLANRPREIQDLVEFRTGPIPQGNPITYNMKKSKIRMIGTT